MARSNPVSCIEHFSIFLSDRLYPPATNCKPFIETSTSTTSISIWNASSALSLQKDLWNWDIVFIVISSVPARPQILTQEYRFWCTSWFEQRTNVFGENCLFPALPHRPFPLLRSSSYFARQISRHVFHGWRIGRIQMHMPHMLVARLKGAEEWLHDVDVRSTRTARLQKSRWVVIVIDGLHETSLRSLEDTATVFSGITFTKGSRAWSLDIAFCKRFCFQNIENRLEYDRIRGRLTNNGRETNSRIRRWLISPINEELCPQSTLILVRETPQWPIWHTQELPSSKRNSEI